MPPLGPLGPLSRLSSNQDIQLINRPGGRSKPRLGGIGKAPGARNLSGKLRPHSGKHTKANVLKSGRKASITRAKRIASGLSATKEAINASVNKPRVTSLAIPIAARKSNGPVKLPPASLAVNVDSKDMRLFIFDARTTTNNVPAFIFKGQGVNLRIPVQPGKVDIPPLENVLTGAGACLPVYYVRKFLTRILPRLFMVGSYYQAYPHIASPPGAVSLPGSVTKSFAFGIPRIVSGRDKDGVIANAVRGFEPDACLTIGKRTATGEVKGPFRVVPISHTVYSAWFSHFPRVTNMGPSGRAYRILSPFDEEEVGEEAPVSDDLSLYDDIEDRDDNFGTKSDCGSDGNSDDGSASTSSISAASALAELEIPTHIHLPVVTIGLPSPETFDLIHLRVHTPRLKWQPALLGLRADMAPCPAAAEKFLTAVPTSVLGKRAQILHGVWANLAALGCDDKAMWAELHSAWGVLIRALTSRACTL